MIKKMKYETPEIEITSFELERGIMGNAENPGDIIPDEQSTPDPGDSDDLFKMLEQ